MDNIKIVGVRRANKFSPNHIGNDAAIFDETVIQLKNLGHHVTEYTEDEFINREIHADLVFNMSRRNESVQKLKKLEDNGIVVVNSGYGIENCTRERMTTLLLKNNIPHPRSIIVNTKDDISQLFFSQDFDYCWIKRGDFHAIHREDVSYSRNFNETKSILKEYSIRGISRAVINEHLRGDLIKFYGVEGTDFFFLFYPFDLNHSKFGHEQINGKATGFEFSLEKMKEICKKAANTLQVKIYGGDCIVAVDGSIKIIDFNDWPSFAPCRDLATPHIASCIVQEAMKSVKKELLPKCI